MITLERGRCGHLRLECSEARATAVAASAKHAATAIAEWRAEFPDAIVLCREPQCGNCCLCTVLERHGIDVETE